MQRLVIRKIEGFTFAKFIGSLYAVLGLIEGAVVTIMVLFGSISKTSGLLQWFGVNLTVAGFAIVIVPLVQYFVGWVVGFIATVLYNWAARYSHGITFDVEERK